MEIVDPKCPKCGGLKFAYKHIPKSVDVQSLIRTISEAEERFKSYETDDDKTKSEPEIKRLRERFDVIFDNPQPRQAEAMMVFCINCGEIVGIGGGHFNV